MKPLVEEFRGGGPREELQGTCSQKSKVNGMRMEIGKDAATQASGPPVCSLSRSGTSANRIDVETVAKVLEQQLLRLPDAIREALILGNGEILEMCLDENCTLDYTRVGGVVDVILATEEYGLPTEMQEYLLNSYPAALFSCLVDGNFDPPSFLTLLEVLLDNKKAGFFS